MDLQKLTCVVRDGGAPHTVVRPGITLCLFYAEPAWKVAPAVADILEAYIAFVPTGALQTYLAPDGRWKKATQRTFNSTLEGLRTTKKKENAGFNFGQEPLATVGNYGAHFTASPMDDPFFALETAVLYLEFPPELSRVTDTDQFIEFVRTVCLMHPFDSGYCGLAFKYLHLTFLEEAFDAIGKWALRYIGFSVDYDFVRMYARGHVYNVSWLTLLGRDLVGKLGGAAAIRAKLAGLPDVAELGSGVMIRAAEAPIVGDVNRGAADAAGLRKVAQITKPLRIAVDNIGPDDEQFASRWLSRLDV
jgi:hypothetical protein